MQIFIVWCLIFVIFAQSFEKFEHFHVPQTRIQQRSSNIHEFYYAPSRKDVYIYCSETHNGSNCSDIGLIINSVHSVFMIHQVESLYNLNCSTHSILLVIGYATVPANLCECLVIGFHKDYLNSNSCIRFWIDQAPLQRDHSTTFMVTEPTNYWNQIFYTAILLNDLRQSCLPKIVNFQEDVHLVTREEHLQLHPAHRYIKRSFGWEIIEPLADDNEICQASFLVLSVRSSTICLDERVALFTDQMFLGPFGPTSTDDQYRPQINFNLAQEDDPLGHLDTRLMISPIEAVEPYTMHPDLLYTMACNCRALGDVKQLLMIWKHDAEKWPQLFAQLVTGYMDRIDAYFLSVIVSRGLARHNWPVAGVAAGIRFIHAQGAEVVPGVGVEVGELDGRKAYVIGINRYSKQLAVEFADVHACNSTEDTACEFRGLSFKTHDMIVDLSTQDPTVSVPLRLGDDLGQVGLLIQQQYGINEAARSGLLHRLNLQVLSPDLCGAPENVLRRREVANNWLTTAIRHNETAARLISASMDMEFVTCSQQTVHEILTLTETLSERHLAGVSSRSENAVTIIITTCKRLNRFLRVMDAISDTNNSLEHLFADIVHTITVIDDFSSAEDRQEMMARYPQALFVMKPVRLRGHAASLNLALRMVSTRYVMYLEDDWLLLSDPVMSESLERMASDQFNVQRGRHKLLHYLHWGIGVLQNSLRKGEAMAQVLFNDQISSSTARGLFSPSHRQAVQRLLGTSGWSRYTGEEHSRPSSSNDSNNNKDSSSLNIPYQFHEFGLASVAEAYAHVNQARSLWPGFSLNPGLWDLKQIDSALHKCSEGRNQNYRQYFNESDDAFEIKFSLLCHAMGLSVGYFPMIAFEHIGEDQSAYTLNGLPRVWDMNTSSSLTWSTSKIFA